MGMMMKKLLAMLAASLPLLLVGCGGGGSSNNGNAEAPGRTHFAVNNTLSTDIAKIEYVSDDNEILFSQSLSCVVNAKCDTYAVAGKPGNVMLYNKNGQLIAAYPLAEAPSALQFVTPSDHMTGVYIYQALIKQSGSTNQTLNTQLDAYFSNFPVSAGYVDIYESLGRYFKKEVIGKGVSYNDFLTQTNASLTSGQVLASTYVFALYDVSSILAYVKNQFRFQLISSAQASAACTAAGAFLPAATELLDFFPGVGTVISGVLEASNSLIGEACDDTSDQLRSINEKLDQISADLKAQNQTLSSIADAISTQKVSVIYRQMITAKADLAKYLDTYVTLLGTKYPKLSDYVKAQGGLKKAYDGSTNFANLIKSGNAQGLQHYVGVLESIGDNDELNNLTLALRDYCKVMPTETGDLVQKRTQCNLWQIRYNTFVIATWANNEVILRDIVGTISQYATSEKTFVDANLVLPGTGSKTGIDWSTWDAQYLTPKMNAVYQPIAAGGPTSAAEHGMFRTSKDLNTVATNNWDIEGRLNSLGCYLEVWVPNDNYIHANCPNPNKRAERVKSVVQYAGNLADTDLVNIYGVLVPRNLRDYNYNGSGQMEWRTDDLSNDPVIYMHNVTNSRFKTEQIFIYGVNESANEWVVTTERIPTKTDGTSWNPNLTFERGVLKHTQSFRDNDRYLVRLTSWDDHMSYLFAIRFGYNNSNMNCLSANCSYPGLNTRVAFNKGVSSKPGPNDVWYLEDYLPLQPYRNTTYTINGQSQQR